MPDINAWLGITADKNAPSEADRATDAWKRILDNVANKATISIWRNNTFHHTEVVRLEAANRSNEVPESQQEDTVATRRAITVYGVRNHPDGSITDTDIQEGDIFGLDGDDYSVLDVISPLGEVQATCVRLS